MDRHGLFVEVVGHVLERRGYRARAIAVGARSAAAQVRRVEETRPDVVVLGVDFGIGSEDGDAVLSELVDRGHPVIAVIDGDDPVEQGAAFAAGAHAVVSKSRPLADLLEVVDAAAAEEPEQLSCSERARLVAIYRDARDRHHAAHRRFASLSRKEQEILRQLMAGRTVREIASRSVVSEHTVRTQVKSLLGKLDVSSQIQAVALARRSGWGASPRHRAG
ncbi:helix-turn-helix transcriptional regulator [Nocardioides mangrovi]|nr:response regulator transcription factor [Nocardioides mangrovi]